MARATHVKAARKDYPEDGIAKGDSYWWWKFRYGGKHRSKTAPARWQLTQSPFYSTLWQLEDEMDALAADDGLSSEIESLASQLNDLADECQGSLDNMPEGLQEGDTGQMLQERIDACQQAASELKGIPADGPDEKEDPDDYWQGILEEIQAISIDAP